MLIVSVEAPPDKVHEYASLAAQIRRPSRRSRQRSTTGVRVVLLSTLYSFLLALVVRTAFS